MAHDHRDTPGLLGQAPRDFALRPSAAAVPRQQAVSDLIEVEPRK
jgi:hypothetical protein